MSSFIALILIERFAYFKSLPNMRGSSANEENFKQLFSGIFQEQIR